MPRKSENKLTLSECLRLYLVHAAKTTGYMPDRETICTALRISRERYHGSRSVLRSKGFLVLRRNYMNPADTWWEIDGLPLRKRPEPKGLLVSLSNIPAARTTETSHGVPVRRFESGTLNQLIERAAESIGAIVYRSIHKHRGKPWHLKPKGHKGPDIRFTDRQIVEWLDEIRAKHGLPKVLPQ